MSKNEYPIQIKTPFYAIGQVDTSGITANRFKNSMSFPDNSANVVVRNKFSVRSENYDPVKADYAKLHVLDEVKQKNLDNYLSPVAQLTHSEKYGIKPNHTNMAMFNRERLKLHATDCKADTRLKVGQSVDRKDFMALKSGDKSNIKLESTNNLRNSMPTIEKAKPNLIKDDFINKTIPKLAKHKSFSKTESEVMHNKSAKYNVPLKENDFYFDKSLKEVIKRPKGYWGQKREYF